MLKELKRSARAKERAAVRTRQRAARPARVVDESEPIIPTSIPAEYDEHGEVIFSRDDLNASGYRECPDAVTFDAKLPTGATLDGMTLDVLPATESKCKDKPDERSINYDPFNFDSTNDTDPAVQNDSANDTDPAVRNDSMVDDCKIVNSFIKQLTMHNGPLSGLHIDNDYLTSLGPFKSVNELRQVVKKLIVNRCDSIAANVDLLTDFTLHIHMPR